VDASAPSPLLIAIDGPAASGKSSVARRLAWRLGLVYVNTGAMYRAVAWLALSRNVPAANADAVVALLDSVDFRCGVVEGCSTLLIDGIDPDPHLLVDGVNATVSQIAAIPGVRTRLVALQRETARALDSVMVGRDIGSAVFPETPFKFYIDASLEVRAQRRARQGLADSIQARDRVDSTRRTSPLIIAEDAHVIDSSNLTIDGVVGEIIGRLKLEGLKVIETPGRVER
jgi:cytidylate kinase